MPQQRRPAPKEVVYLLGAGATQAEVDYLGAAPVNLLMHDDDHLGPGVSTQILEQAGIRGNPFRGVGSIDVEKLISLLATSRVHRLSTLAEKLRQLYFDEIRLRLIESRIINHPRLAIALFQLHHNNRFKAEVETVTAFLSTNHDGLLQLASQSVFGGLAIGFPFKSSDFTADLKGDTPLILQLHGSFTWEFGVPARIARLQPQSRYSPDRLWLPPSVLKESKDYPFNKLSGLAYELLARRCDVLRVIGSSLRQNDWNIVSLIFHAQRHREQVKRAPFAIELVMSNESGKQTEADCSYLKNLMPIEHLTDGEFARYKEPKETHDPEMDNAFAFWLKQKARFHHRRDELSLPLGGEIGQILG